MNIFCAGLNYKTTSLEIRERLAVSDDEMEKLLRQIHSIEGVFGAVVLSTCNRVEFYASTLCPLQALGGCRSILQEQTGMDIPLYHYSTPDAVRHLFRVASGLDSMVIGETEIFGQVKNAYSFSAKRDMTTHTLHRLFQHTFRVTKHVRTETNITRGASSVGSVAVQLAEKIFGKLEQCRVMILGAGEISERTARSLQSRGVRSLIVSNRHYDKAVALAAEMGGMALHFDHWDKNILDVDIIISATGAPHAILTVEKLKPLLKQRQGRPLFIIDLAVPRDAEPSINKMEGVFLYDIDSLQKIASESIEVRRQEVVRCESLIEENVREFLRCMKNKTLFQQAH
ncbi:MAG: glutamyl-tRNA reductase [Verrucomicrobia bacterium]|jgi:glutamyl-tRNA reductase|nr:MAG: glutamyl-tRNA reductase [Verrucomicrobiota bacterium]MDH4470637.1 glutamyl-tRNA reductase [Verrucomicrobiae bacterium]